MDTSMILICIWLVCRLCTALHTKCWGAVRPGEDSQRNGSHEAGVKPSVNLIYDD